MVRHRQIYNEIKVTPEESDLKKLQNMATELKLKEYKIISKNHTHLKNTKYGFMLQAYFVKIVQTLMSMLL